MSLKAPKTIKDNLIGEEVINHNKKLENMDDKELMRLIDTYAKLRLLAPDSKHATPEACRLSKPKGTSFIDENTGARCLEVQQMKFERRNLTSDLFEKNCVINFDNVLK